MPKTFHIRDGLTPTSLKDINSSMKKQEPIKSILSEFIKNAERKSENQSRYSKEDSGFLKTLFSTRRTLAEDRRHVKDMLPFEGTTEVTMKGCGDYGFFTAIFECYNRHWGLRTTPDDWWYTIIRTVAMAIDNNSKSEAVRKYFVNHKGKKRLTVKVVSISGINHELFFREMTNLIQSNIKVDGYVNTIRSDFSTSTETHRIVSEITVIKEAPRFWIQ